MKLTALAGLAPAPKSSRSAPRTELAVDNETLTLLEQFGLVAPQFNTLKKQKETLAAQAAIGIKRAFFSVFAGVTPPDGTIVATAGGREIKLIVKNAYSSAVTDDSQLRAALGDELVNRWFRTRTTLKLDFDKVPEDKAEAFAEAVIKAARDLDVLPAVQPKECIQPKPGFHEARTTLLNAEQNLAVDAVLPITAFPML